MKVIDFDEYLDGGTVKISTDKGIFCFDNRIHSTTKNKLYLGYPKGNDSNIINDSKDLENKLINALKEYKHKPYQKNIDKFIKLKEVNF